MSPGPSRALTRDVVWRTSCYNVAFAPTLVDVKCALGDAGYLWEPPAAHVVFAIESVVGVVRVLLALLGARSMPTQWTTLCLLTSRTRMALASVAFSAGTLTSLLPLLAHVSLSRMFC